MKWLLYWADCKRVRAFTNQDSKHSQVQLFFQGAYEGGKGGGKRDGLEIGIYLSLACVLVVCGI